MPAIIERRRGGIGAGEAIPYALVRKIECGIFGDHFVICSREARVFVGHIGFGADEVQKSTRWIVVPDGLLAAIPFDTLFINGAPIAAHTVVSYAPSLGLLIDLTDRLKAHQSLRRDAVMVIGAPAFDRTPAASPLQAWGALPGSKTEVSDLARQYRLTPGKTVFTGTDATEARLRQLDERGALMRYKLIIFSTHAIVDPASSERNAIILIDARRVRSRLIRFASSASGVGTGTTRQTLRSPAR